MSIDFPNLKPVREYTRLQGRFHHLTNDMIEEIEEMIHQEYEKLKGKAGKGFRRILSIIYK